ncbi:polysaccharide pyruvyl transferase family protein [Marinomonas shanghaiensis]|uniref:polysaccharide pyruvyl transferase family protein n=1 Tax=Marinomonas shanghaiensis TaxID=2202418 RepID=UPI000DB95E93|nr:polysaccharide pyruvyl transferase family protein [Marinomonas shanghaiensis]
MKIAILTQPLHNNYGGNLQNFALQTTLKKMGHDPVTIDRHLTIKLRTKLKLGYFKNLALYHIKGTAKPLWKNYFISKKKQAYVREDINYFIDQHINKTPRLYSDASVENTFLQNDFDVVIVGSDQVWRPIYSPNIYTYYLDFLQENKKIKKIAYAASFGTEEWEYSQEQTTRCKDLIQQFDLVTVREKSAVQLVAEKLNKKAEFVLDPTLLLSRKDYMQLFNGKGLPENKGIYTYILDSSDLKTQVVEIAKKTLGQALFSYQCDEQNVNGGKLLSVEGWVKGFSDANFVITDSFHGCVFSIIFNKPFIVIGNIERGLSRFYSLLNTFNLMDRLVLDDEKAVFELVNKEIDWKFVNSLLTKHQRDSIAILDGYI